MAEDEGARLKEDPPLTSEELVGSGEDSTFLPGNPNFSGSLAEGDSCMVELRKNCNSFSYN